MVAFDVRRFILGSAIPYLPSLFATYLAFCVAFLSRRRFSFAMQRRVLVPLSCSFHGCSVVWVVMRLQCGADAFDFSLRPMFCGGRVSQSTILASMWYWCLEESLPMAQYFGGFTLNVALFLLLVLLQLGRFWVFLGSLPNFNFSGALAALSGQLGEEMSRCAWNLLRHFVDLVFRTYLVRCCILGIVSLEFGFV